MAQKIKQALPGTGRLDYSPQYNSVQCTGWSVADSWGRLALAFAAEKCRQSRNPRLVESGEGFRELKTMWSYLLINSASHSAKTAKYVLTGYIIIKTIKCDSKPMGKSAGISIQLVAKFDFWEEKENAS
jgi:hypothetical protein